MRIFLGTIPHVLPVMVPRLPEALTSSSSYLRMLPDSVYKKLRKKDSAGTIPANLLAKSDTEPLARMAFTKNVLSDLRCKRIRLRAPKAFQINEGCRYHFEVYSRYVIL